ncbi:hypothetical protein [Microbacterium sp. ZW T5_56]|uniref:hypothetical protein n=1 Tax=Microbacterium sp. ZW T5_56 TaxID=3378081 RepID=UPI003852CB4F
MLAGIPDGSVIDLLVISHFDHDHVNGLDHLSAEIRTRGINVRRVWAPILGKIEALYAAASTPAPTPWYLQLLDDPRGQLSELFEGAEVTFITPDGAPILLGESDGGPAEEPITVIPAPGTRGIAVQAGPSGNVELLWEIQPYVVPSTLVGAQTVAQAVQKAIGKRIDQCTLDDLRKIAADTDLKKAFHDAVMQHHRLPATQRASSSRTGANLSTLCLYSGPVSPYQWCHFRRGWAPTATNPAAIPIAPAWLGTGDAGLKDMRDVQALERGLTASRLDRVGIASAPHHGSRLDSGAPLWDALPNVRKVTIEGDVPAGGRGQVHPHVPVLTELKRRNLHVHVAASPGTPASPPVTAGDFNWTDKRIR